MKSTTTTSESLKDFGLDLVNCQKCHNSGMLTWKDETGALVSRDCECMAVRRSLRRIKNSGMEDMLKRYSFATYLTPDAERMKIKAKAQQFAEADSGWFFIGGQSGSGKSHICTAICSRLIERGKETYYMRWRDESRKLKAIVNDEEIEKPLKKLKKVDVLYIDDFFKGGSNDADVRIAFEILNARYNDSRLRTVISSELTIDDLLKIDEALGGRIYERCKGYMLKAPAENWRMR